MEKYEKSKIIYVHVWILKIELINSNIKNTYIMYTFTYNMYTHEHSHTYNRSYICINKNW